MDLAMKISSNAMKCWLTSERKEWIAAVFVAALIGFWIGNGHTTQGAVEHISQELGCEHSRADKTAKVAKQAIVSAYSDNVPIPDAKAIPKDCPHL
jgi:hypothetical protein